VGLRELTLGPNGPHTEGSCGVHDSKKLFDPWPRDQVIRNRTERNEDESGQLAVRMTSKDRRLASAY